MAHERARSVVELIANIAVAVAAIAIVWRLFFAPAPQIASLATAPPGGRGPTPSAPAASPVESIESRGLTTTLSSAIVKGAEAANVVLIEFSDYECPFCARHVRETFAQIDKEFVATGKVRYVFRNFPLATIHKSASRAAQAAECAGAQGKYWEMHQRLFASQAEFAAEVWTREAEKLRLNAGAFEQCMRGTMLSKVDADLAEGQRLGAQATPTFFIGRVQQNGTVRLISTIRGAHPYAVFKQGLSQALE